MSTYSMPAPWRIEGRATPFHPWVVMAPAIHRLERALTESERIREAGRFYAVRIRAN